MATKKIKKVFPVVEGTEVSIRYKNRFGNMIAVNINDNGYPIEDNNEMTDDLKIKIMRNIQNGLLVVREVEVKTKKSNEEEVFLNEFEKLLKPKSNTNTNTTTVENKSEVKHETPVRKVTPSKKEEPKQESSKKETSTPLTKKK